jgi:predicted metal-dependent HD superfamily phosphohydrolase
MFIKYIMADHKNILEDASRYIFNLFKEKLPYDYVYHNYQHTLEIVETCKKIAKGYNELSEEDLELLLLAAWFHDAGYTVAYKGHEEKSEKIAEEFLQQRNFDQDKIPRIKECISSTNRNHHPQSLIAEILADADISSIGEKSFFVKADLLRREWEKFDIRYCSDSEWAKTQLDFLQSSHFHTKEAQRIFGEQLQINITDQTKKLEKIDKKKEKAKKEKDDTKAEPRRGIETMFRSIYRNHINLSSIADSKANMMISINSLIISITLTLLGAKLSLLGTSFKQNQIVIYPILTLLLTSLAAIIFAILSAKPKVSHGIEDLQGLKKGNFSILFFGNYTRISLKEFEMEMRELMKSEDELYGNMIKDLYYLGKVLSIKYKLIKISYIVFMSGLIFTILVTVFVVIYLKETD